MTTTPSPLLRKTIYHLLAKIFRDNRLIANTSETESWLSMIRVENIAFVDQIAITAYKQQSEFSTLNDPVQEEDDSGGKCC